MSEESGFKIEPDGSQDMTAYRADSRLPGKLQDKSLRRKDSSLSASDILSGLLADPFTFAQTHVATNSPTMVSAAFDQECGGYSNGRHVYKIELGSWTKFKVTHDKGLAAPTIYADAGTLEGASLFAMSPGVSANEVDFLFDVPTSAITEVKRIGKSGFEAIDWSWGDLGIAKGKVGDLLKRFQQK